MMKKVLFALAVLCTSFWSCNTLDLNDVGYGDGDRLKASSVKKILYGTADGCWKADYQGHEFYFQFHEDGTVTLDSDFLEMAKKNGTTRAVASMDKAAALGREAIFAVGNAPTALVRLYELIKEGKINPELIIAVPVGFVNVVQSKELILSLEDTPSIVARGRKGGSNIAACICNALLYQM